MIPSIRSLTCLTLAFAACSGSKDAPSAGSAAAPAPTSAAPQSKLDCDRILPAALRAKYFAGYAIEDHSLSLIADCELRAANGATGSISVDCPRRKYDIAPSVAALRKTTHGVEDLSVGAAGLISHPDGATFIAAWDDDSPCSITMMIPNPVDATALAKDLIASLPPA